MNHKSLIDKCLKKAALLKKDSKFELSNETIQRVESELSLLLPEDFKILCNFYGYDVIGSFDFFSFPDGVIGVTKRWREAENFPKNCIALSEVGESAWIMRINYSQSEVIWCDILDIYNICEGKPMQYNPDIFHNFVDFYSFLLDEEERDRLVL